MRRPILMLLACLMLGVWACGEGTVGPLVLPDPADATTCAELSDMFEEMTADMVEMIGDAEDFDEYLAENEADGVAWLETTNEIGARTGDLCDLDAGEFEELVCGWLSSISPADEAGRQFLEGIEPPGGCP